MEQEPIVVRMQPIERGKDFLDAVRTQQSESFYKAKEETSAQKALRQIRGLFRRALERL
jgi:hypothetical protein